MQCRQRSDLGIAYRNKACARSVDSFIESFRIDAGRELDRSSVGGGQKRVGQRHNQMGILPEAVERTKTRGSEELAVPLQLHDRIDLRVESLKRAVYAPQWTRLDYWSELMSR